MHKNIEILNSVCWDYDINAEDVFKILSTKDDSNYPITFDEIRYKVLRYISFDKLQLIFTNSELKDIFQGIKLFKIRNNTNRSCIQSLLNEA